MSVRGWDFAGESVEGQVESSGEVLEVGERARERPIEGIGGQVKVAKGFEGSDLRWDWT